MKLKTLTIAALFVAGVAASVAVAKGPPPGKGKNKSSTSSSTTTSTTKTKTNGKKNGGANALCRPTVSFVLKGEFESAGAAAAAEEGSGPSALPVLGSFVMHVQRANRHGRTYRGENVTVSVDAKTSFRRRGHAALEDFEAGDWLNVAVRACHPKTATAAASAAAATDAVLLARRVVGKPAKTDDAAATTTTSP